MRTPHFSSVYEKRGFHTAPKRLPSLSLHCPVASFMFAQLLWEHYSLQSHRRQLQMQEGRELRTMQWSSQGCIYSIKRLSCSECVLYEDKIVITVFCFPSFFQMTWQNHLATLPHRALEVLLVWRSDSREALPWESLVLWTVRAGKWETASVASVQKMTREKSHLDLTLRPVLN